MILEVIRIFIVNLAINIQKSSLVYCKSRRVYSVDVKIEIRHIYQFSIAVCPQERSP